MYRGVQTGRLNISRGRELVADERVVALQLVDPNRAAPAGQVRRDGMVAPLVPQRLEALERLAALYERGILTDREMEREKALILSETMPAVSVQPVAPSPRPSLLGRLLRLRVLACGLILGAALSIAAQPEETARFADEMVRLIGI